MARRIISEKFNILLMGRPVIGYWILRYNEGGGEGETTRRVKLPDNVIDDGTIITECVTKVVAKELPFN